MKHTKLQAKILVVLFLLGTIFFYVLNIDSGYMTYVHEKYRTRTYPQNTTNIYSTIDPIQGVRVISESEELIVGNTTFSLIIADDPYKRQLGLSEMIQLGKRTAMLFVFDTYGRQGFWMKDMKFPIDIAWLDAMYTVVHVEKNVSPDTYPETFFPKTPALFVVELPAGTVDELNVHIGDTFKRVKKKL